MGDTMEEYGRNEHSKQTHDIRNPTQEKKQKFWLYIKAACIIVVGYWFIYYLLGRFSLSGILGFATGIGIGLVILFTIMEIQGRYKKMKQPLS
jgi:small-conductance mechanosensitive channel